jgi:hypothetical protein
MTKAVYAAVFPAMAAVYAAQDAQINKNVQNMAEVNVWVVLHAFYPCY